MGFKDFMKKFVIKPLDQATEFEPLKAIPVVGQIDAAKDAIKAVVDNPGTLLEDLKNWPEQRLNAFLVRLGRTFGPDNLRHFSELSAREKKVLLERVPILKQNHAVLGIPVNGHSQSA